MDQLVSDEPIVVLVIEDDPDTRANLRDILELDNYEVATASTAAEALGRDDWPRFSAVILDRQLPDATADVLLPRLRREAPHADIIIVTGYGDIHGAVAALRQGAADYILKPLNPDALRASLGRVVERRRLAAAKERSEAMFRHLVEAAECMILILRADRTVRYFSPFAERVSGYSRPEIQGRDVLDRLFPAADRPAVGRALDLALGGRTAAGFEGTITCLDGSARHMVWNARPLEGHDGATAVLMVGHDITFLKQAQERALRAERLAAIGQMVTGLAHESRNALQRSQACLEMLALVVNDRPAALDLIARVQTAQDHLHHLFEDVRNYAAPIHLDRSPCVLSDVWREAWATVEPARREKSAVLREAPGGEGLGCEADTFRLGQVFRNIFDNALAASPGPAAITISAAPADLGGTPAVRVTVRDNGPGLDAEQRRHVFEPFYTTKAKGTGLGMAIAKRIVEAHGGRIAVEDDGQRGAAFTITLPGTLP